jgi:hypothetical protein
VALDAVSHHLFFVRGHSDADDGGPVPAVVDLGGAWWQRRPARVDDLVHGAPL